ncbi:RDD family protein [Stenotrophobium rhamnosiphilum]|uniref:RDD family protein n=1 Tax=Stenotrophobium rhamnosiphilum TaxID=2029166 RepID=A0A2T5MG25_9GAMM|nr:RDD family protein [Stenotrophobium rhamnosiphilum]PTU31525.1 hypothetical protein CJD38_09345 [Stenotrophobium rhamnosiphilum]
MSRYFVADHGVSTGPFNFEQIREKVRKDEINAFTLMWKDGMADWAIAQNVLASAGLLQPKSWPEEAVAVEIDQPVIAAFGRRIAAALIDGLVMFIPATILIILPQAFLADTSAMIVGQLLAVLGNLAYFTLLHGGSHGATIGKRALDIRVVRDDGSQLGDMLALGRYLLLMLSALMVIPLLVPLFNRHRKGLHDMVCGTVVLEASSLTNENLDLNETVIGTWGSLSWVMVGLMVVIPFAGGVVAAVSVPAYQDYVIRSKVAMAIEQARDTSEKVVAYRSEHGQWPTKPTDIGLPDALDIADVATLHLDANGTVALNFTSTLIRGRALHIRMSEDGHRQCTTNLPRKYTDRACSRSAQSPSLARSTQPTM